MNQDKQNLIKKKKKLQQKTIQNEKVGGNQENIEESEHKDIIKKNSQIKQKNQDLKQVQQKEQQNKKQVINQQKQNNSEQKSKKKQKQKQKEENKQKSLKKKNLEKNQEENKVNDNENLEDQNDDDDQELNLDDFGSDKGLEALAKHLQQKQKNTQKIRERKIVDFKFRVVGLLEMYLQHSENPQLFIQSLIPICQYIRLHMKDKQQQDYLNKLSNQIRVFIQKQFTINNASEQMIVIEEKLSELEKILSKTNNKRFFSVFSKCYLKLIKVVMEQKEYEAGRTFFQQQLQLIIKETGQKKNVYFTEDFIKDLFKINHSDAVKQLGMLLQLANLQSFGGSKEFSRKIILNLLHYIAIQPSIKAASLEKQVKKNQNLVETLITGAFQNYSQIKKQKFSDLRKYSDILIKFSSFCDIKDKIQEAIQKWDTNDSESQKMKTKIEEKLKNKQ